MSRENTRPRTRNGILQRLRNRGSLWPIAGYICIFRSSDLVFGVSIQFGQQLHSMSDVVFSVVQSL